MPLSPPLSSSLLLSLPLSPSLSPPLSSPLSFSFILIPPSPSNPTLDFRRCQLVHLAPVPGEPLSFPLRLSALCALCGVLLSWFSSSQSRPPPLPPSLFVPVSLSVALSLSSLLCSLFALLCALSLPLLLSSLPSLPLSCFSRHCSLFSSSASLTLPPRLLSLSHPPSSSSLPRRCFFRPSARRPRCGSTAPSFARRCVRYVVCVSMCVSV